MDSCFDDNDGSRGKGYLHLIMGPMYSGKSTNLISKYNELKDLYKEKVVVITHEIENRYSLEKLSTHERIEIDCKKVADIQSIVNSCSSTTDNDMKLANCILVDEVQFFPDLHRILDLVEEHSKTVYVYGLDGDFKRNKFGNILDLIPFCDTVTKLRGNCEYCEKKSLFSWRNTSDKDTQVVVGAADKYVPLCRKCYLKYSQQND